MATPTNILESNKRHYRKVKDTPEYREYKRTYNSKWRKDNFDKVKLTVKKSSLKSLYGLSYEDYLQMLETQQNRCLLCQEISSLVVDHSHKTKEVRGLLCNNCNMAIGLLKENKETLKRALEYL